MWVRPAVCDNTSLHSWFINPSENKTMCSFSWQTASSRSPVVADVFLQRERERERVRFMVQTCSLGLQLTHKLLLRESAVSRRPAGSAGRLPRSAAFTRCSDTFMGRRAARCEEEPQVDLDKETCWKISNTVLGQLKRAPAVIPEEKQQLCRNKTTTWTTNKTKQDSQKLN